MSQKSFLRAKQVRDYRKLESSNCQNVPQPVLIHTSTQGWPESGIRTGFANPKWRSQVEMQENASTNFSGTKTTIKCRTSKYLINYKASQANCSANFTVRGKVTPGTQPGPLPMLATFDADNLARQQFFKNAVKAQRFLQSGVFIGELRETLGMIRNPARGLRNLVSVLTKDAKLAYKVPYGTKSRLTRAQKANHVKQAIADSWLEFSFGWSPLAADLDAAAGLLSNLAIRANDRFVRVDGQGRIFDKAVTSDSVVDGLPSNTTKPFAVRQQLRTYRETTVRYYGMIRLDLPSQSNSRLLTGLGLTLNDVAPTAWELIPWSFFVDYFSNIGDIIEAWSYPRAKIAWVSRVERREMLQACFWTYNDSRTRALYGGNSYTILKAKVPDAHRISTVKEVLRTASVEIAAPVLRFELPSSSRKFLNIGALIASGFRRPRSNF